MLEGWTSPAVAAYKGRHGMTLQPPQWKCGC
ncbi:hypothetical protein P3T23_000003 [Paraburkholderia sp. GAS448]